jgi:hypothetical protein
MKRAIVAASTALLLATPAAVNATSVAVNVDREPEGCQAMNPVQPKCTFTSTQDMEGPVAGAVGYGTWKVIVKRGKKVAAKITPASSYGEPYAEEFLFEKGDKVTVIAISPGSAVTAGGD